MKKTWMLLITLMAGLCASGCQDKNEPLETFDESTQETQEETTTSQWMENELTGLVDKPGFGEMKGAVYTGAEFSVSVSNATIEDTKIYVEDLKTKGFSIEAKIIEEEALGILVYSYSAKNEEGITSYVEYSLGVFSLTLSKNVENQINIY